MGGVLDGHEHPVTHWLRWQMLCAPSLPIPKQVLDPMQAQTGGKHGPGELGSLGMGEPSPVEPHWEQGGYTKTLLGLRRGIFSLSQCKHRVADGMDPSGMRFPALATHSSQLHPSREAALV